MKILAVDDDPEFRSVLYAVLNTGGYEDVSLATAADDALSQIQAARQPFECFLLDVQMPGTNGVELCRRIRAMPAYKTTPILMLTASQDEDTIKKSFDAGATDYVTKPLNGVELGARIRSACLMNSQMRELAGLEQSKRRLRTRLDELLATRIDQPVRLSAGPNCMDYAELENLLFLMPDGLHTMNVFALHIRDIERLHATAALEDFHALLENIARGISTNLMPSNHYISYAGNGSFACVLLGRQACDTRAILATGKTMQVSSGDTGSEKIDLTYSSAKKATPLSGRGAVEALRAAIGKAPGLSDTNRLQQQLDTNRLGRTEIVPRRVVLRDVLLSGR